MQRLDASFAETLLEVSLVLLRVDKGELES